MTIFDYRRPFVRVFIPTVSTTFVRAIFYFKSVSLRIPPTFREIQVSENYTFGIRFHIRIARSYFPVCFITQLLLELVPSVRRFLTSKYTILLCQNFRNGWSFRVAAATSVFVNSFLQRCDAMSTSSPSNRVTTFVFSRRRRLYRFMAVVAKFPMEIESSSVDYCRWLISLSSDERWTFDARSLR